jgi:hypothetical protein
VLGETELRLALALYDVLALAHPATDSWTARDGARRRVLALCRALAGVPAAETRDEIVARHALLHMLPQLVRQDVRVRWWIGHADFKGQKPPRRLTAWPNARNVRVESETVPVHELLGFEEGVLVHAALLAASPLTELLQPDRPSPGFAWGRAGAILRDAELARAVAFAWLAPGRAGPAIAAAAEAWERMLHQAVTPAEARATTAFLVHLAVLAAMDEGATRELEGPAASLFWALPDVIAPIAPAIAMPPGAEADAALVRRWRALRAHALAELGDARVEELRRNAGARL